MKDRLKEREALLNRVRGVYDDIDRHNGVQQKLEHLQFKVEKHIEKTEKIVSKPQ